MKGIHIFLLLVGVFGSTQITAEERQIEVFDVFKEPCLFVSLINGGIDAYPLATIDGEYRIDGDSMYIELLSGNTAKYHISDYFTVDKEIPRLPYLTSYKFNNKYNPNLNQDIEAESISEVINLELNAIGKSLTASFQLSDSRAIAYVGKERQKSKETRNRFDKSIKYTITYPEYNVILNTGKIPFGRIYTIETIWSTDKGKVARIDIDIEKRHTVTSKNYYLKSQFRITGYDMYDDFIDSVQIKGRGNNSWNYNKKSYRLKFSKKVKPFGLTKGKSWVLLANPQNGSQMVNAIAMKIGQLAGAEYTNHIIPVELYINGKYQGSYIFTEKIGFSNNSVDHDEEYGCLLELDSYYDEIFRFRSAYSDLPINIKEPNLQEEEESLVSSSILQSMLNDNCLNTIPSQNFPNQSPTTTIISNHNAKNEKFNIIKRQFNRLDSIVSTNGDIGEVMDLDAAARFVLVNDLAYNVEIYSPKSTFIWKSDIYSSDSKFIFGPIWDFDYAFGYSYSNEYFTKHDKSTFIVNGEYPGCRFFTALKKNREFQRYYYKVWCEFVEKDCITEVMEYISDYYELIRESYDKNAKRWGDDTDYGNQIQRMQQWIKNRHDHIFSNLTKYDITDLIDNTEEHINSTSKSNSTNTIYTIYGENITDTENLRQGLYIINGKKVFIKRR